MAGEQRDVDAEFERWLLESARREPLPSALTEPAWGRFVEASGRTAGVVATGSGSGSLGVRLSRASLAWLTAGLVGGSGLTLAVISNRNAPRREQPPAAALISRPREKHEISAVSVEATAPATHASSVSDGPDEGSKRTAESEDAPPLERGEAEPRRKPQATSGALRHRPLASTLAAEVQALDSVREHVAARRHAEALAGVTAFHRAFPRAQLAADAEGLAIEALLGQNDTEGAARRARRFLRKYPDDPHAARFAPLAEPRATRVSP